MFYTDDTVDTSAKKHKGIWAGLKSGVGSLGKKLLEIAGTGFYGYRVFRDGSEALSVMQKNGELSLDEVGKVAGDVYGTIHFGKAVFGHPSKERGILGTAFNMVTTECIRTGLGYAGAAVEGVKDGLVNGGEPKTGPVIADRETLDGIGTQESTQADMTGMFSAEPEI